MVGKLNSIVSTIGELIILNLLWFICCIPVVTIGSSTAALYGVLLKKIRHEDPAVTKEFFRQFKENLKKGILLTLICIGAAFFIWLDIIILTSIEGRFAHIMMAIIGVLGVFFSMVISYMFPILANYELRLKDILKNSVLSVIAFFPRSIIIVFLNAIPFIFAAIWTDVFIFTIFTWILIGISVLAYLNAGQFNIIFHKTGTMIDNKGDKNAET